MKLWHLALMAVPLGIAACTPTTPPGATVELPEGVRALIAPGQDTTTARIESDGCYWYLHRGPVETTYIPLETRDGRMICTRPQG